MRRHCRASSKVICVAYFYISSRILGFEADTVLSDLRASYRLANAIRLNICTVFLNSRRYRTLREPNWHLITPNACSTLAGTSPYFLLCHFREDDKTRPGLWLYLTAQVVPLTKNDRIVHVDQIVGHFCIWTLPVVVLTVCTRPLLMSPPICAFIPKCHGLPFFIGLISGSRLLASFLVEGEAAIQLASAVCPYSAWCKTGQSEPQDAPKAPPSPSRPKNLTLYERLVMHLPMR